MKDEIKLEQINKEIEKLEPEKRELTSEFGTGCLYNLGLFLKHWLTLRDEKKLNEEMSKKYPESNWGDSRAIEMTMNGASDHFYNMEIPENIPQDIKDRLKKLQDEALDMGHGKGLMGERKMTFKEGEALFDEALSLLMWFDENLLKVKSIKGDYE